MARTLGVLLLLPGLALAGTARESLQNPGFEVGDADRPPGWQPLPYGETPRLDSELSHGGNRSLRVSAHGGMRSELVPYSGGRVMASGWMRTWAVVTGPSAPWHKAALQIISYDADRRPVGHFDVALVDGTTEWTRYEAMTLFSRAVAYLSLDCHLWGEDASGTVWFDDLSLQLLDDPRLTRRKPLDLAQATVSADFSRRLGEFRHLWVGSDVSYSDRVVTDTQITAMRQAKAMGFRYVRLHDCLHNPAIYSEDAEGRPIYRWEGLDARLGAVVDQGLWPVVVLETTPPEFAAGNSGLSWTNPFPPKGPEGYAKWQELVRQTVAHCRERWGEDIRNWYFEVWNEPDASGYFSGTLEEYLQVYDHAVAGATAADPLIRIGGPGGAGTGWCRPLLEHCATGRNAATGGIGCRIDFLSWHIYTVGVGIPAFDTIPLSLSDVRQALRGFPQYRRLPTLITEWGCSASTHPVHDRPYDAAFRVSAVRHFLDHGITLALPFALGEGPPHAHDGFLGGLALYTKTGIPKPSARAFELLHRMVGWRVVCESSNDPVDGLACLADSGDRAWVMLWNLVEDPDRPAYTTRVTVRLRGLAEGWWTCRGTSIAPGQCDPFLTWQAMGSPERLTPEQEQALRRASALPPARRVPVTGDTLSLDMPGYAVVLLELTRHTGN